jgi:hypothetical protein
VAEEPRLDRLVEVHACPGTGTAAPP